MHVAIYNVTQLSLENSSLQTEPYSTPLEIAATKGHPQTVERLLEGGALINHQRPVCYTIITIIIVYMIYYAHSIYCTPLIIL